MTNITISYNILISDFNSSSIRQIATQRDMTHMAYLGAVNTDPTDQNRPDWSVSLYEFSDGYRVLDTNADCITQDEDGFSELESQILNA